QPISLEGNRSNNLYKLACTGRDYGLSQDKIEEILTPYNDSNNQPPLTPQVLRSTTTNAFTYAHNPQAEKSMATAFKDEKPKAPLSEKEAIAQAEELLDWKGQLMYTKEGKISRNNFATK